MRTGFAAPIGRKSPSPWPSSLSAPTLSRMTRLSVEELTANASRLGTFALIRPVTTSTDGRCVASTRWMPAARASCVMRTIESSTSRGATIIRSASSSTTTRRYGYGESFRFESGGSRISPFAMARLKSSMCRKPNDDRSSYRMSISFTTHCSASAAFFGFVMMGVMRCGTPS